MSIKDLDTNLGMEICLDIVHVRVALPNNTRCFHANCERATNSDISNPELQRADGEQKGH